MSKELRFGSPLESVAKLASEDFAPVSICFFCITTVRHFNFESPKAREHRFLKRFRETVSKITSMRIVDFLNMFKDRIPLESLSKGVFCPSNTIPDLSGISKVLSIELGSKKDERFIGFLLKNVFYVLAIDFGHDAYGH